MLQSVFGQSRLPYLVFFVVLLISGCATLNSGRCTRFEQIQQTTNYDTTYTYSKAETRRAARSFARRPRRTDAAARWYTLRLNRTEAQPCEHLYLIEDLYLQRSTKALTLEEQREFYTAQGQLITKKREDVTAQLPRTGYYTASVPLPIPREAPAGAYRIVTHLIATSTNGREQTLATSSAEFRVQ